MQIGKNRSPQLQNWKKKSLTPIAKSEDKIAHPDLQSGWTGIATVSQFTKK